MKRALLVSTAIVGGPLLLATPAMAGGVKFSIGGNMDIQAGFMSQDVDGNTNQGTDADRGYDIVTDTEIQFNFRGEADNGLRYGAQVQFEADTTSVNNSDETWAWLEGNWGRVFLGDQDGAEDTMIYDAGLTQSGVGGIDGDIDRWFNNVGKATSFPDIVDTSDATKVTYYSPRIEGIQIGASWTPDTKSSGQNVADDTPAGNTGFENVAGLGINYNETFNAVGVGVSLSGGFGDATNQDREDYGAWVVGGFVDYAGFSLGGSYDDNGDSRGGSAGDVDDDFFYDVGIGYSEGPWGASIGYLHSEFQQDATDDEFDIFALAGGYTYAPGLYVYADLMFVKSDSQGTEDNDGTVLLIGHILSF
jgi:outer membrane protein OmpU